MGHFPLQLLRATGTGLPLSTITVDLQQSSCLETSPTLLKRLRRTSLGWRLRLVAKSRFCAMTREVNICLLCLTRIARSMVLLGSTPFAMSHTRMALLSVSIAPLLKVRRLCCLNRICHRVSGDMRSTHLFTHTTAPQARLLATLYPSLVFTSGSQMSRIFEYSAQLLMCMCRRTSVRDCNLILRNVSLLAILHSTKGGCSTTELVAKLEFVMLQILMSDRSLAPVSHPQAHR